MAFMKINGFINSTMLAMSDNRGLNEILEMLRNDPRSIDMLSGSEKTFLILFVAGLGMAVTFAVLIFLWFSISVLSVAFKSVESKKAQPSKIEKVNAVTEVTTEEESNDEDEELIAVIAAAVAASLNTSIHNIVVKNIVRVNDHSPSWAKTGRIEQMNTRF